MGSRVSWTCRSSFRSTASSLHFEIQPSSGRRGSTRNSALSCGHPAPISTRTSSTSTLSHSSRVNWRCGHGTGLMLVSLWLLAGCSAHRPHSSQGPAQPQPAPAALADTTKRRDPWKSSDPSFIVETNRPLKYYIRDCNKNGVDDDEDIDRHVEDDINGDKI